MSTEQGMQSRGGKRRHTKLKPAPVGGGSRQAITTAFAKIDPSLKEQEKRVERSRLRLAATELGEVHRRSAIITEWLDALSPLERENAELLLRQQVIEGGLYIDGRQLKACIKEAACVRWPDARWGPTRKGTKSFFAEHVFVVEDRLPLGVTEPTGVMQRFVHTFRGNGIQYEEFIEDAKIDFTIITDYPFKAEEWALLWLTAEQQGLGASRSQGFGRFDVTRWDKAKD